jgi:hypothetical protein
MLAEVAGGQERLVPGQLAPAAAVDDITSSTFPA